jgi:undecaprenyl-diphosphatase
MFKTILNAIVRVDRAACIKISGLNGRSTMDRIMRIISRYGDGYLYPLFGLLIFVFDRSSARIVVPAALVAFPAEILTQLGLKFTFRRRRPCLVIPEVKGLVALPEDFGFPSGHTAGAFLLATLMAHVYPVLLIPGYIIGLIVGLSRVYNGVHYPGDIVVGAFLGIGSARLSLVMLF